MVKIRHLKFAVLSLISVVATAEGKLQSLNEINDFIEDPTPRTANFELTGRVLSVQPTPLTGEIILSDAAGTRTEFFRFLNLSQPTPGDTIRAGGLASMSKGHEPYIRIDELEILAHGPAPKPTPVRLTEMDAKAHHLMTLTTEGLVIDAFPDEIDRRFVILLLKEDDVVIPVPLFQDVFGDRKDLLDARIRVTGIYRRSVGGARKFSWPNITPHAPTDIEVLTPPPADPFAVPPIEDRLYLTSADIAHMTKRSIVGEVLATWSDNQAMLRARDGRIVNLRFANGTDLPTCGETIIAAGQPETDLYRINLSAARWKSAPGELKSDPEVAEAGTTATFWDNDGHRSIDGAAHGKLISFTGIVRTLPTAEDSDFRFVVDAGNLSVPVDISSNPAILDNLAIGCKVQVTGRCILLTDMQHQIYGASKVRGLALVVRSPADVRILKRPSWWTPLRFSVVIALLLATIIAIFIWNRALRKLADRRGRELYREQVAHAVSEFKTGERTRLAVELHDSLSQTLSGVACHLTVGTQSMDTNPATAREYLATARQMLNACRTELRQCLFDLRSDTLEEKDFATALRKTLDQIDGEARITIDFDVPRRLFKDTEVHAILCIVRELTGNAIRHGKASEVKVEGSLSDRTLRITVTDNGQGFDPDNCDGPVQGHFGLEGIRNRLEKLNGNFALESAPGSGAKATVTLTLPAARTQESANHE